MRSLAEYSRLINESLIRVSMNEDGVPRLYAPVRYTLDGGGKRLRPVLVLMACEAVGGCVEDALSAALGVEMFHNFTLLHDDVMDCSDMRHGRPTVHARWDMNTAILSGDAMLTLATELVMGVPESRLRVVLEAFNQGALDVYEGQAFDMEFEEHEEPVSLGEYLRMIGLKTGALIGSACMIGALAGGASKSVADAFYEYGMKLGLAFQIHDDYLDMYGDPIVFGKPIGGDVQNNKQTYLLVSALSGGGNEAVALREAMKRERGERKLAVFREIYDSLGIADTCREATLSYCREAVSSLKATGISMEWHEAFSSLAKRLTDRVK